MLNVLVTGGSRGLGLAIARALADAGYRVIAVARSEGAELRRQARRSARTGRGAIEFRACDLSEFGQIAALVARHPRRFRTPVRAGQQCRTRHRRPARHHARSRYRALVRLNTLSPIVLTKYVVRSMMIERQGRIVNIASIVAATGYSGLSVYSATKASLVGFTRSLARELGQLGITVNAVAPGFIETAMTA